MTFSPTLPARRADAKLETSGRTLDVVGCAVLVILVLALFLPTVGYGFVNWDDPWYVADNPLITSWRPTNLWTIATKCAVRNYAPLTQFGYLVQHSLWGNWPGGYHFVNVLLHAVNTLLAYVLIRQLTGRRFIAWTTAALFGVHPVQIETVAWVSSFKGCLSATFILASLICWLRPHPSPRRDGLGILFHFLGLLSKALGITVPAIVFSYDVLIGKKRFSDAIARQFIPVVMGMLVLGITMSAQTAELGGIRNHLEWSKARIAAVDLVLLWRYIGLLIWPRDLCVLYDVPTSGITAAVLLAAGGWLAVGAFACAHRRRQPLLLLALITFGALLFPVLNFFPITTLMNDRYLYLPSLAIFALMAATIQSVADLAQKRLPAHSTVYDAARPAEGHPLRIASTSLAFAMCAVLILGYATATQARLPVWRDDTALWEDAIEKSGGLPVVRIQWAFALYNAHQSAEAVAVLERTLIETRPDAADRERIQSTVRDWRHDLSL